jgi:hypothetical protein
MKPGEELVMPKILLDNTSKVFPQLSILKLFPTKIEDARLGFQILQRYDITDLTIDCAVAVPWQVCGDLKMDSNAPVEEDDVTEASVVSESEDVLYAGEAIAKVLFQHMDIPAPRSLNTALPGLRRLALSDVDLRDCKHSWFRHLNFKSLDDLSIKYCFNADIFFAELTRIAPVPEVKSLTFVHDARDGSGCRALTTLEEYLVMSVGRLRRLELSARYLPPCTLNHFSVSSINKHRKTLAILLIDLWADRASYTGESSGPVALRWDGKRLKDLLCDCENLSQLAIAFPGYYWTSTGSAKMLVGCSSEFWEVLVCLTLAFFFLREIDLTRNSGRYQGKFSLQR